MRVFSENRRREKNSMYLNNFDICIILRIKKREQNSGVQASSDNQTVVMTPSHQ